MSALRPAAVCLVVLDGWGLAEPGPGNAVSLASTPVFDELWQRCPHTTLTASGSAVGLPEGQMGNSEVGHLNLGAGAVVRQDLVRIDEAVAAGTLAANPVIAHALRASPRVHLLGLASDGGVHSSLAHLQALIAAAAGFGVEELFVHCFTDGRDTAPHSGAGHLEQVERWCREAAPTSARVASVIGRYYAMDRDRRWERTQLAYDLIVHGQAAHRAPDAAAAVHAAYERGESDEFIAATAVDPAGGPGGQDEQPAGSGSGSGAPADPGTQASARPGDGRIRPGDSVLCFNFRPDRMRQITRALAEPGFGEGAEELPGWRGRAGAPALAPLATLTEYEEGWTYPVAFPPARPAATLAGVLAAAGERQLHVAETEKYAHVTYFFNGGQEAPQEGEQRELVASPRDVPTYDRKPEMSAREVADAFVDAWRAERPRFAIINFANPDMVGHSGVIPAAVRAVESTDECLGRVLRAVLGSGGVCLVTADHGNAEHMLEADGSPNTAHSLNPVPFIVVAPALAAGRGPAGRAMSTDGAQAGPGAPEPALAELIRDAPLELRDGGILADVALTVLALLDVAPAPAMSGRSLIVA